MSDAPPSIREQIESSCAVIGSLLAQEEVIGRIAALCVETLRGGKKILTCGNGGSSTDAMHLSEELVARYRADRDALPSLCLAVDPSVMTCIANDFGWEEVFARQVEAHGRPGDLIIAFTTSGKSENINRALRAARARGIVTVGILGKGGGQALPLCDHAVVVDSDDTPRIQEAHTLLLHIMCEAVERAFVR
ncbi:SIS domain-containing protein [Candidatus Sumerlaeota bacterium]|nr:SIS domain-containing protein [Candidatus Sumerlaeota bacterium]